MRHLVVSKQPNSKMCFVCGLRNSLGLRASFYELDNGDLVATFTPETEHQGYPGRLHGGIASAVLDETIGRAILLRQDDDVEMRHGPVADTQRHNPVRRSVFIG